MLFYNFNDLDNFIKNNLIEGLTEEKEDLLKFTSLYKNKKKNLTEIITNIIDISDYIDKNYLDDFYQSTTLLKTSFEKINEIENLIFELTENINSTILLYDKDINNENNYNEVKANLVEYNKQKEELLNKILEFENINITALNTSISILLKKYNKKSKNQNKNFNMLNNSNKVNIELEPYDYNTLIISEKEQKAYLPFFYKEIKNIYEKYNNKYKTMQDVINELYIIPLDKFKNSAISRFREAFNLIRNKEKGSVIKALDLGLELMFKYELNPIIIAGCRNLDELDIYLDCLEEKELNDFKCFEIKFEVMPKIIKGTF